jgi:hypothetical protein
MLGKFFVNEDETQPKKHVLIKDVTRNLLVNEGQLRKLLRHCPVCATDCGEAVAVTYGVDVEFCVNCANCDDLVSWSTQPPLPSGDSEKCDLHKGNLDVTAAIVLCGRTLADWQAISRNLNLEIMSDKTFYA